VEFINGVSVREYTLADLKEITIGAEVHGEQPPTTFARNHYFST
jgi:hypothetical protein